MKRLRFILLLLTVLGSAPAGFAGRKSVIDRLFVPATQPSAPVDEHIANDLPLKMGADGAAEKYLRQFATEPRAFTFTTQLLGEEETFRVYRLTFTSPFETPWPENNRIPAEYYVPRSASPRAKVPAAVVLDIMDGSAILPRVMARAAAQHGLAALYLPMPCYNDRRPQGDDHQRVLRDDPARAADGLRQTVMDVRRAKSILVSLPEVDATHIGLTGISLGGIMTALAAGVDGEFDRVVPILSGGDVAAIIFHAHETRKLRAMMVEKGMDQAAAAEALAPVEPLTFAPRIGPDRCLMINADKDEVIPKATTLTLQKAMGGTQIVWLPAGHYSSLAYFPLMQKTVIDFLRDGKRPN